MRKRFALKRKFEQSDFISITIIALLALLFVFIGIEYTKSFGSMTGDTAEMANHMKDFILSYGALGIFVFIVMQIIQVVITAIPGALVQLIGGVMYGLLWGTVISEVGILLGSMVSFYLSRLLGKRIVTLFVSKDSIEKIDGLISSDTSSIVLLVLFAIPGLPKDVLPYVAGLTDFKAPKFFLISTVGRLPGIFVSNYLGAHLLDGNLTPVIVVSIITCIIFFLLYIFRKKILSRVSGSKKSG